MHKTAVFYGFACAFYVFVVNTCLVNRINAILLRVIFTNVLEKAKAVVRSLNAIVADKPQIASEKLINKGNRQGEDKEEYVEYISGFYKF